MLPSLRSSRVDKARARQFFVRRVLVGESRPRERFAGQDQRDWFGRRRLTEVVANATKHPVLRELRASSAAQWRLPCMVWARLSQEYSAGGEWG